MIDTRNRKRKGKDKKAKEGKAKLTLPLSEAIEVVPKRITEHPTKLTRNSDEGENRTLASLFRKAFHKNTSVTFILSPIRTSTSKTLVCKMTVLAVLCSQDIPPP